MQDINNESFIGVIEWSNHWVALSLKCKKEDKPLCHIAEFEIIGNIHENPELINKI